MLPRQPPSARCTVRLGAGRLKATPAMSRNVSTCQRCWSSRSLRCFFRSAAARCRLRLRVCIRCEKSAARCVSIGPGARVANGWLDVLFWRRKRSFFADSPNIPPKSATAILQALVLQPVLGRALQARRPKKMFLFGHLFLNITNVLCAKKRLGHACICPRMVTG